MPCPSRKAGRSESASKPGKKPAAAAANGVAEHGNKTQAVRAAIKELGRKTPAKEVADLQQRDWLINGTATLELTELGTNEFARLLELVSGDRTTLMMGIAPEEYASTVSVLERMARNLGWTPLEDRPHSTKRG